MRLSLIKAVTAALMFVLLAALMLVGVTGCGDDESSAGDATRPVEDEAAIRATYKDYFLFYKAGDGERACPLLTAEYRAATIKEAAAHNPKVSTCSAAVFEYRRLLHDRLPRLTRISVMGDRATGVDPAQPPFPAMTYRFERDDGRWLVAGVSNIRPNDLGAMN